MRRKGGVVPPRLSLSKGGASTIGVVAHAPVVGWWLQIDLFHDGLMSHAGLVYFADSSRVGDFIAKEARKTRTSSFDQAPSDLSGDESL